MASYSYRLPWPPGVNQVYGHTAKGFIYLTARQREFRESVGESLPEKYTTLTGRLMVVLQLQSPTKHKYDIDGKIKAVLDALEHWRIVDNDELVDVLHVLRLPVGKPGAADVLIRELN